MDEAVKAADKAKEHAANLKVVSRNDEAIDSIDAVLHQLQTIKMALAQLRRHYLNGG